MKTRIYRTLIALSGAVLFTVLSTGCDPEESSPTVIPDRNFYLMITNAMRTGLGDIFNQNLAGKPTGNHNLTVPGPLGGTVTITGSGGYSSQHGINTVDLIYDMQGVKCAITQKDNSGKEWSAEVTLNGKITYKGSFDNDDLYSISSISQGPFTIKGHVKYKDAIRTIDQTGDVSINVSGGRTSYDIFGYTDSWD